MFRPNCTTWLVAAAALLLSGCAAPREWQYLPTTRGDERTIHVVSHGWHTGVILSRRDLGPELAFLDGYLPEGAYYEFGWGEADFYQAEEVTTGILLKAVFGRNATVMHVVAVPTAPAAYFRGEELIELNVSRAGLDRLKAALRASFTFDGKGRPCPLKKGLYGESRFFRGEGWYAATRTCNSWTAAMLQSAGVPIDTAWTLRAGSVMRQAREAKKRYPLRREGGLTPHLQGAGEQPGGGKRRLSRCSPPVTGASIGRIHALPGDDARPTPP